MTSGDEIGQVERVIGPFLAQRRLVRLPARRARRRLVLERIAEAFEPGRRFPEREVDVVLRAWCDGGATDHVAVRRYLVDEGLLSRADGLYWRSGGWVDVLGPWAPSPRPAVAP